MSTFDTSATNRADEVVGLTADDLIADRSVESVADDALGYMSFVKQLARLVASADTPVNIALFGPWGSGKSTVGNLLRAELESNASEKRAAMPFVRYDAWRFAGLSLQRSFISEAAEGLGIRRERYHRRLYQDQRTGGFRLGALVRNLPAALVTFAFVLGAIIALATGLAALAAVVAGKDVGDELRRQAPTLLPVAGLISVFAAIARPFLDAAGTQMSEAAPVAAEQFRVTFTRLIADGLKRARRFEFKLLSWRLTLGPLRRREHKRLDRVVFFIDELDRCSPEDVVEALRALKTFLEVENCVFLVAADRDVVESALDRLPQTTPLNEEAPYFSSAASFLDKVFQYQIPLPPLRGGRRLRSYVRELVRKPETGLWRQIQTQDSGRLLERIVYTLIPSHVRSPRRAKVLLNKFAANARIAEAHQILWIERAEEIAKLTVLQTEFPAVAADLRREPRLPGLLLRPPRDPSPALALLLARHDVGGSGETDAIGSGAQATSYLLAGGERPSMVRTQRSELRRYLELTATVPDAQRDLLFLETGGQRTGGLEDARVMDEVETNAPEAPDKVAESVKKLESEKQRRLVADVLLDLSETAVGREKRNVVTALLTTVNCMTDEATQVADRVAAAVRVYRAGYELPSHLLTSALRISELQQVRTSVSLTDDLLTEGELWSDRGGVLQVLRVAATLHREQLDMIERRIAASVERWPELLAEAIRGPRAQDGEAEVAGPSTKEGVENLLQLPEVARAVSDVLDERGRTDEEAARELADALHGAGTRTLDGRDVSVTAIPLLRYVGSRFAYDAVRRASDHIEPHPGTPEERCNQALLGLCRCGPKDWEHWLTGLQRFEGMSILQAGWAVEGMVAVFGKLRGARGVAQQRAAIAIIEAEVEVAESGIIEAEEEPAESAIDEQARTALTAAVQHAIAPKWWDSDRKRDAHRRFHAAARALTRAEPGPPAGTAAPEGPAMARPEQLGLRVWRLLEEDLRIALHEEGRSSPEVREVVRELAAELPVEHSARLAAEMDRVAVSPLDVEWAVRFGAWLRSVKAIGVDEAGIDELARRASVERLRAILDRERFDAIAARLEPLLATQPPTVDTVARVAFVLKDELGTAGQRFARLLLQCLAPQHEEELSRAVQKAEQWGFEPAASLGATVAQAGGRGLLDFEGEPTDSTKLRVARPAQVVADRLTTDVAIVGSGAAGATVAHRLARAGQRVLVLERGRLVDPDLADRAGLIREALGTTRHSETLAVLQAECVGGSTLIGDGIAAGLPQTVLDEWRSLGVPLKEKALRDAFDRVARDLSLPRGETTLDRAAGRAGKGREDREVVLSEDRAGQLSMLGTLLLRAQHDAGSEPPDVLSECRVERLEAEDGRVTRVRCKLSDGRTLRVEAKMVVLAAGAIQSSAILRRSRLGGREVGARVHFNVTALLLAEYDSVPPVPPGSLRYFEAADSSYVTLTRAADARGTVAGMPGWFEDIAVGRRDEGAWTVTAVTVGSTGSGRVDVPDPGRSRSRLSFDSSALLGPLIGSIRRAGQDAFEKGARRVRPASHRPLDVREENLRDLELLLGEPGELMLISGQPLGGNPMGMQHAGGVVDEDFRVHGMKNLYVCDASVMPTATTVYPQLTIMALADHAAARLSGSPAQTRNVRTPRPALRRLRTQ